MTIYPEAAFGSIRTFILCPCLLGYQQRDGCSFIARYEYYQSKLTLLLAAGYLALIWVFEHCHMP